MIEIENGRRIANIPDAGVSGKEIIDAAKPRAGRRIVIQRGIEAETVIPDKRYPKSALIDKKGRAVKAGDIPDRTKASFGGSRSALSKRIITDQVFDIATNCFKTGVQFDDDEANWMVVKQYVLPNIWHHIAISTPLMVVFPTEYPELPPIGFYLKSDLEMSANGHLYAKAYHEACREPLEKHWKWYCVYIQPGSWRPAPIRLLSDWKRGDSVWTYFMLINEVLASPGD
jgi:hypothetical protein